ncbi:MAG: TRAP transporter fused permease subunit, partial [Proteobacteria bacterium]|nr:TRAP transporter fused permease subunit [Pseudomonadota bacterium]
AGFWYYALLTAAILAIGLSVYQLFSIGRLMSDSDFMGGIPYTFSQELGFSFSLLGLQYLYLLLLTLLPFVFIYWPAYGSAPRDSVPWYDVALFLTTIGVGLYFVWNGGRILDEGWEYEVPAENFEAVYLAYVLWALVLDATRRVGSYAIVSVVALFSIYPFVANQLPGILLASSPDWQEVGTRFAMGEEAIFGIPMRAFGNIVIGFLIFGVALQHTGGGTFFLNLAFALLGHVRGGPAKVAIFASGLMGSMSGSVVTNVLTTGVMTIPTMKRVGFRPAYVGGVEACASTGGVLMPPIMGATAFVMALFLEVPYRDVAIAAVIPSAMYFFGLFMQIDAYSARHKLKGLPLAEMPSLKKTMKEGWYFIAVFALLVWMLVFLNQETIAPYYATVLLIVLNQVFPYHRWNRAKFVDFIGSTVKLFAELAALLAVIGIIVGALEVTGKIGNLASDLLSVAGGSNVILLLMGAFTSFVLGIGMTVTAAYVFLAIALAPALIQGGMNPMSVHMFIFYWGMLSFITPPVALGAYAAAPIARAAPMSVGFEAMRLGSIIYFIPFFFVFDPAFIWQGPLEQTALVFGKAMIGIVFVSGALQGYLVLLGDLGCGVTGWISRLALGIGGITLATPGNDVLGVTNWELAMLSGILLAIGIATGFVARRQAPALA